MLKMVDWKKTSTVAVQVVVGYLRKEKGVFGAQMNASDWERPREEA